MKGVGRKLELKERVEIRNNIVIGGRGRRDKRENEKDGGDWDKSRDGID